MKLAVIIVSYNVKHYLMQCIDSVKKATQDIEAEIFVIDNHSRDNTPHALKKESGINLITCNKNHGFSRANNIAIKQSNSEYVLLLNPDTIVGETSIKKCIDFLDNHPKAGGAGVCMIDSNGNKALESRRGLPTPLTAFYKMCGLCNAYPTNKTFGRYYMGWLSWDDAVEIQIISGAFFMIRREALNKVGLLDEDFFMYGEDIDLSYRLLKHGYQNWYIPTTILHYKGESTKKSSFKYIHVFYEAMLIFFRKHFSHFSFWLSIPIKIAIYMRASIALMKIFYTQIRKALGFWQYKRKKSIQYIFLGNKHTITKCKEITRRNGIEGLFVEGNGTSLPEGHLTLINDIDDKNKTVVVYDTSLYSYEHIFNILKKYHHNNICLGTYSPKRQTIITGKEIFR